MNLHIVGSSSAGNAYILENDSEALLIECGLPYENIKRSLNFLTRKVVGCIITHDHGDHAKYISEFMRAGIDVWASQGTHIAKKTDQHPRARFTYARDEFRVGGFKIAAFEIVHDAAEPLGFVIEHTDCGRVLFLTDTHFTKYTFPGLSNIIIEANYCEDIVRQKFRDGGLLEMLRDRTIISHMSLQTCKATLSANDLSRVKDIVLIHLSDRHSDSERFKREVSEQTGRTVTIAVSGLKIPLSAKAF